MPQWLERALSITVGVALAINTLLVLALSAIAARHPERVLRWFIARGPNPDAHGSGVMNAVSRVPPWRFIQPGLTYAEIYDIAAASPERLPRALTVVRSLGMLTLVVFACIIATVVILVITS
jgi:hypothetical protein